MSYNFLTNNKLFHNVNTVNTKVYYTYVDNVHSKVNIVRTYVTIVTTEIKITIRLKFQVANAPTMLYSLYAR